MTNPGDQHPRNPAAEPVDHTDHPLPEAFPNPAGKAGKGSVDGPGSDTTSPAPAGNSDRVLLEGPHTRYTEAVLVFRALGLVIGLGGLGAILLVAMVVVAARSMKGDGEEVTTLTIPTSSAPAATGIAEVTATETQETPPDTPPTDSSAGPETASGPKPSPAPSPAPKSNPSPGPAPAPAPAATPKGDPCDACINAAQSGNISGAAAAAGKCSDAGKKAQCQSIVKSKAPPLAQAAAFNGNCAGAKAIAAAATQMGAGSGSLNSKLKTCK
jgi:hypothetical protein